MQVVKNKQKPLSELSGSAASLEHLEIETTFQHPRFIVDSPVMLHVPFLFWIVSALQPRALAVYGVDDGAAYFALCQALDKRNINATCHGYGSWTNPKNQTPLSLPPQKLCDHATQLYNDIHELVACEKLTDALDQLRPSSIDLLFIDLLMLGEEKNLDCKAWINSLKNNGVLLLHGNQALPNKSKLWEQIERASAECEKFEFLAGNGLTVFVKKGDASSQLKTLVHDLFNGERSHIIAPLLRRLGQGFAAQAKVNTHKRKAAQTQKALKLAQEKSQLINAELTELRSVFEMRSQKLSELQTTLFTRDAELMKQADQANAEKVKLESECEKIRAALKIREASEAVRFEEIAILTRSLEEAQSRFDAYEVKISEQKTLFDSKAKSLEIALSETQSEIKSLLADKAALLDSTSWRITSPIRKTKRALSRE